VSEQRQLTKGTMNMIKAKVIALVALAAMGIMMNTAGAAVVVGSSTWTSLTSGQTVNVDYQVDLVGASYIYNYQIEVTPGAGNEQIHELEIDLSPVAAASAVSVAPTVGDIAHAGGSLPILPTGVFANITGNNVTWTFLGAAGVTPGFESVVVAFASPLPPTLGTGSAIDDGRGPWSAQFPGSALVAVPVPEPTTIVAGALLLLPFGASTLRVLRKSRSA